MKLSRKGFTLIELIVVIIIIGILAAIAAPSMTANVTRAKRQEAIAAMGSIRTAYRLYCAEKAPTVPTTMVELNASGYIVSAELNGPNYNLADYTFSSTVINANSAKMASADGNCAMNMVTGNITNP